MICGCLFHTERATGLSGLQVHDIQFWPWERVFADLKQSQAFKNNDAFQVQASDLRLMFEGAEYGSEGLELEV